MTSPMASSTSSLPHRSHSPSQSLSKRPTSTLETLVPHLLASKRSLSSISHVYRANELCTSTRQAIENSALIIGRTAFVRNGIQSQLGILHDVQQNTAHTARQAKAEHETVIKHVDEANRRLQRTLDVLRETFVEPGLRPEAEERKTLVDFVDEGGVEETLKANNDVVIEARDLISSFENTNLRFKEERANVDKVLDGSEESAVEAFGDGHPLPNILHEMERYAKGMARELESLVNHYDLCVKAIKHTEGGSDAAFMIAKDVIDGEHIKHDIDDPGEQITDEERDEMVKVIEDDAGDVEGAVVDIKNHLGELESLYERVEIYNERMMADQSAINTAFNLLEALGRSLPSYITQSQVFAVRWESAKVRIDERLEELEGLTQFYEGFLGAYDNLLIEVGRRKTMEQKMEKEVQATRARLDKLYEDDAEQREAFRKEQGEFLPVDIWPDLVAGPPRFEVAPLDHDAAKVPNISSSVIHRAIKRVHGGR